MKKSIHTHEQHILQRLLRELREKAGWKQTDLAARLDEPQQLVSRYESGEKMLDLLELRQICHVFGLTLPEFATMFEEEVRRCGEGTRANDT